MEDESDAEMAARLQAQYNLETIEDPEIEKSFSTTSQDITQNLTNSSLSLGNTSSGPVPITSSSEDDDNDIERASLEQENIEMAKVQQEKARQRRIASSRSLNFSQLSGGVLANSPPKAPADGNVSHLISSDSETDEETESKANVQFTVPNDGITLPPKAPPNGDVSHLISSDSEEEEEEDVVLRLPNYSSPIQAQQKPISPLRLGSSVNETIATAETFGNLPLLTPKSATRRQSSNLTQAGFAPLPVDGDVSKLISSDSDSILSLPGDDGDPGLPDKSLDKMSVSMSAETSPALSGTKEKRKADDDDDDDDEGVWEEFIDEDTGFPYLMHSVTGESRWKEEGEEGSGEAPSTKENVQQETTVTRDFEDGTWETHIEPESGASYYLNPITGESVWVAEVEASAESASNSESGVGAGADKNSTVKSSKQDLSETSPTLDNDEIPTHHADDEDTPKNWDDENYYHADDGETPSRFGIGTADDTITTIDGVGAGEGKINTRVEAFDGESPLWAAAILCHRRDETVAAMIASQQRITLVAVCSPIGAVLLVNKKQKPRAKSHSLSPRVFCLEDTLGDVVRALVAWGAAAPVPTQDGGNIENNNSIKMQDQGQGEDQNLVQGERYDSGRPPLPPPNESNSITLQRESIGQVDRSTFWRLFYPGGSCELPFPTNPNAWHDNNLLEEHCQRQALSRSLAEVMAASPVAARLTVDELLIGVREVPFVCCQGI